MIGDSPDIRPVPVRKMREMIDPLGYLVSDGFHVLGLFAILAATVFAGGQAFFRMAALGHASIEDLLLLFIYLEIGSMVGIYFRTNHMPVRFLLYVGITALTRHMIGYVQKDAPPDAGILILAGAVLVVRYASATYGSGSANSETLAD